MQFKTLAFLSILSILFFTGCDSKEESSENNASIEKEIVKPKISDLQLTTADNTTLNIRVEGDKITFKDYPNKVVLLNFFATWCPPCKAEIPSLIKLQKKYKNDFTVVSVLLEKDKPSEEINEFIKSFKINYPVTNSSANFELSNAVGPIKSIPTMFLVDKDSTVFQKYVGIVPVEMMEIDIKKVLKK